MYDISVISSFGLDVKFKTEKFCELYVDIIPQTPKTCIRILLVMEPNAYSNMRNHVISNQNKFDLILTFDEFILESCPNAKLFLYGTTWIKDFNLLQTKEYCITTLIGGKHKSHGHLLRHSLPERSNLIETIPLHFYNSINNPFRTSKEFRQIKSTLWKNELFYSQFHIAIENNASKHYFTEKIVDCFQTKTIPIYFGCTNIGEYFDSRGIFYVSSIDDIVDVCNSINEETYENMLDYVNINYEISKKYIDYNRSVETEVKSFIENL